ncbi:MAG: c-type cytochrome biogenesis protein CcmI [Alphaproteobacteria bacterium]
MILLWVAAAAVAVLVAVLLVRPLVAARPPETADRLDFDLAIYRDQLAEVERAAAAGETTAAEAAAARTEVERRILAAGERGEAAAAAGGRTVLAGVLALAVPLGAFGLYVWHGAPHLPGQPAAQRAAPAAGATADLEAAVTRLAARLQERPDDVAGWELLARSLVQAARPQEAAEAYRHLIAIAGARPDLHAAHGEALTMAAGGIVTPAARDAFRQAGDDPRARFYLGEAAVQAGDLDEALRRWTALEADSPADAPWRPLLRRRIAETAAARGVAVPPPAAAAPDAAGDAIMRLPEGERAAAIRSMVEGLAQRLADNPDDREGWRRLGRSWRVLSEPGRAVEALTKAVARFPDDLELRLDLATAQLEAAGGDASLPPAFLETMRAAARLAPEHPQVLWYLGRAAAEGGDPAEARRLWRLLVDRLPAGTPARAEVETRLAALPEESSPRR